VVRLSRPCARGRSEPCGGQPARSNDLRCRVMGRTAVCGGGSRARHHVLCAHRHADLCRSRADGHLRRPSTAGPRTVERQSGRPPAAPAGGRSVATPGARPRTYPTSEAGSGRRSDLDPLRSRLLAGGLLHLAEDVARARHLQLCHRLLRGRPGRCHLRIVAAIPALRNRIRRQPTPRRAMVAGLLHRHLAADAGIGRSGSADPVGGAGRRAFLQPPSTGFSSPRCSVAGATRTCDPTPVVGATRSSPSPPRGSVAEGRGAGRLPARQPNRIQL